MRRDGQTECLLAMVRDVTERRQMHEQLQERERLLRTLGDNLPHGMIYQIVREPDGRHFYSYVSAGVEKLSGYTAEQVLRDPRLLDEQIIAEDRMKLALAEEESARSLTPFELEVRKRLPSGELRWAHLRSAPRRLDDGRIIWDGVELDVTAEQQAEQDRAIYQRQLHEAQRLEGLGIMAGGIAHDFNNMLAGILGNANLAEQECTPGSPLSDYLKRIEAIAFRAAELCKQMLAYAGKARLHLATTDLNRALDTYRPLLQISLTRRANLRYDLTADLPPVLLDDDLFRRVVVNLVVNASEALSDDAGEIVLTTGLWMVEEEFLRRYALEPELPQRRYVRLSVQDTGCGMTPEVRERIFEPFFSTKFTGRGLGLAAVAGIVRSHKGLIKVESEPGRGSCFTVLLPCANDEASRHGSVLPQCGAWNGSGTVLLIDAAPAARTTVARMLEVLGFEVIQATDRHDGLAKFRAFPQAFRFVLLDLDMVGAVDLGMPTLEPSAEEVLTEFQTVRPELPVLLMSGFPPARAQGVATCLRKPFSLQELLAALQPFVQQASPGE
jgi:PAS domain S-box-containing protein